MACGCSKSTKCGCETIKTCGRSKTPFNFRTTRRYNEKCCAKINGACPPCGDLCRSKYITQAAERLAIRRYSNRCCQIPACLTACKGLVCPTTKPLGKLCCPIVEKGPELKCISAPCKKIKNPCPCV